MKRPLIIGLVALSLFAGCKDDPEYSYHTTPAITAQRFVDALNDVDNKPGDPSVLKKEESLQPGYVVIYDAIDCHYRAVSMEYLRTLEYWAQYSSDHGTAGEYRHQELNDLQGIYESERVDYSEELSLEMGFDVYVGRDTGFAYEDEEDTTDVNLMMKDKEDDSFFKRAANVSYAYKVGPETAMGLVKLGDKVQKMMGKSNTLTKEDEIALFRDVEALTGATVADFMEASIDPVKKKELVKNVAEKLGTQAGNLESRILPDMFGLDL